MEKKWSRTKAMKEFKKEFKVVFDFWTKTLTKNKKGLRLLWDDFITDEKRKGNVSEEVNWERPKWADDGNPWDL